MNSDFQVINKKLGEREIFIEIESIKKHHLKGFMSDVYTADSNVGKLVIHIALIGKEQEKQKVWEKIEVMGNFLESFSIIPTPSVFLSGTLNQKYFIVQKFLQGSVAGKRVLKENLIYDVWQDWSKNLENSIEENIALIHKINTKGYGWVTNNKGAPKGGYSSWTDFLESEFSVWLESFWATEKDSGLVDNLKNYFLEKKSRMIIKNSFLVHGDITNPGNILIDNGKVSGILDWEWALAGDPAWDFSFNNRYSLDIYFNSLGMPIEEREIFKERIKLYEPLFLLWGMHVHSDTRNEIYQALRKNLYSLSF